MPSLPPGTGVRALVNVGATVGLALAARSAGLTWAELEMSRSTWPAGARWGGAALAAGAAGYFVALTIPAAPMVLAGFAADGLTAAQLAARALVLIPIGVAVREEVVVRGVLLAVVRRQLPVRSVSAVTSVAFGLWHVSTALDDSRVSPMLAGPPWLGLPS